MRKAIDNVMQRKSKVLVLVMGQTYKQYKYTLHAGAHRTNTPFSLHIPFFFGSTSSLSYQWRFELRKCFTRCDLVNENQYHSKKETGEIQMRGGWEGRMRGWMRRQMRG